ncbi:hypothetical protein FDH86_gp004 [Arthrobacter phage Tank]|uniref:Uncharacterized protein n=1 Tax=Arthrobacter phage Tank TaxID=1772319 RepID=A0A0U4JV07_9CAUD|nr:hypothetical protein FDH86_gp004 [Arthrobacter phage Tank]ALY10539.1 hypothetical protein TANK_4 [Arthrobacter phage Tank]
MPKYETTPRDYIPSTIRRPDSHADCWRLDHSGLMTWLGFPGDVKVCKHGKVMVRMEVGPNSRIAGPGTDFWQTLSPIFNPIQYRRARKALNA